MNPSHITDEIILRRKREIIYKEKMLKQYEKNVNYLQDVIAEKKDFLKCYINGLVEK